MGCEAPKKSNLKPIIKKNESKDHYYENKKDIKRNFSLSTDNSEDESYLDNKTENRQNSNLPIPNIANNNEGEANDVNFDEQKARKFVTYLLENDNFFYKDLIPTINSLSSEDFKKLFQGDCDYNYNTQNKAQIKRLAHKFDNFNYILVYIYKENKYHEYFKDLWADYPYIEDLKYLKDDNKIDSKLSSTLSNYKYWPENIKKDLIKLIKITELSSSEGIKNKIKDEYVEVDKILKKLTAIKQTFKKEDDDEYFSKNDNVLGKDIDKIFQYINNNSKEKNKKLKEEDKQKIQKDMNQQIKDFVGILSPYFQTNNDLLIDTIAFLITKKLSNNPYINLETQDLIKGYLDDENNFWDNDDDEDLDELYDNGEQQDNNQKDEELMEWMGLAKNFVFMLYRGYQTYQTIKLTEKITNEYKTELQGISKEFSNYQNLKRFCKNDPIKNLKIIDESLEKIEEIRGKLLKFIEKLKKEIDDKINVKKGLIGNIIYQIIQIGHNIFLLFDNKNPKHIINIINIGIEVTNIVFSGIDIKYTNYIIDELIKILKNAKNKQKEIENEIVSLNDQCSEIKKAYPKYYK